MRIGFDLRPSLREETGVGVFVRNLLAGLAGLDRENEYVLFSSSWKDRFPPDRLPPFARRRFRDRRIPVRALNFAWSAWSRPTLDRLCGVRLDLTHSPTPLILPTRGRTIVTVCDLFFLDDPARADREAARVFGRRIAASLARADGIVCISEFTRADLAARFDFAREKTRVTSLGVAPLFREPPAAEEIASARARFGLDGPFLLFVGALEPRKNVPGLLRTLAILRDRGLRIPLVLAGRGGGDAGEARRTAARLNLESQVHFLGYRAGRELRALYHMAALLVVPSFVEGFGLPLVEAMACGLPAAVSAAGALPEVGGDAAAYFDPRDPEAMAAAIRGLLEDETARARLSGIGRARAAEFDWTRTAADTLALYGEIAGRA